MHTQPRGYNLTGARVLRIASANSKVRAELQRYPKAQPEKIDEAAEREIGTLKEILVGPAPVNDGSMNLFGWLRTSMATTGYANLKEFQKAEVMLAPSLQTEGKSLQRSQGVGMGR